MKYSALLSFFLLTTASATAQSYYGYRSGNYNGVNGAIVNPANIADSRYKWHVNLFGFHTGVGNNNTSFSLKSLSETVDGDIDEMLFGTTGKDVNGAVNIDVLGPSVMFNINPKTSIALTTRVRAMANIKDVSGKFIQSLNDELDGELPYTLRNDNNQKITVNGWTDWGVSLGRVIIDQQQHFLKGGVTLKYLAGVGNSYINIDRLHATIDQDVDQAPYLTEASGSVGIGFAGIDLENLEAADAFKFNGKGVGADLGLVYEFRPASEENERYKNKYKFKLGVSVMDIGSIKYTPLPNQAGYYRLNVPQNQEWYPDDIEGESVSEIMAYLDNNPYFVKEASSSSSYKVKLPTNLQLVADYAITSKLYLEAAAQINLSKKADRYSSFYYNSFSLTPYFDLKQVGIYLPLSYNDLTQFNAGISFRLGPVYFGSGTVFTALLDKSKQADIHFGISFGGLYKKKK